MIGGYIGQPIGWRIRSSGVIIAQIITVAAATTTALSRTIRFLKTVAVASAATVAVSKRVAKAVNVAAATSMALRKAITHSMAVACSSTVSTAWQYARIIRRIVNINIIRR